MLALLGDGASRSAGDVAAATGLSVGAANRFLRTLVRLGYVGQSGGSYSVDLGAMSLGRAYLESLAVPPQCQGLLEVLAEEVAESTSLAVLDGGDVVYVASGVPARVLAAAIVVGTRRPALEAAAGRVLLAGAGRRRATASLRATGVAETRIPELVEQLRRERGLSVITTDPEPGMRSIAVAVGDHGGPIRVALSVHGSGDSAHRTDRELLARLKEAAADFGRALRHGDPV